MILSILSLFAPAFVVGRAVSQLESYRELNERSTVNCVTPSGTHAQCSEINADGFPPMFPIGTTFLLAVQSPTPSHQISEPLLSEILAAALAGANAALPVYSRFTGAVVPSSIIFYPTTQRFGTSDAVTHVTSHGSTCYISIFPSFVGNSVNPIPPICQQQLIAHEIYHCMQGAHFGALPPNSAGSSWWFERSAEYMSSVVYPAPVCGFDYQSYVTTEPVYHQRTAYLPSVYFHFMADGSSPDAVNDFVFRQTWTASLNLERTRLSAASLGTSIHSYAENFLTGHIINKISNALLPGLAAPVLAPDKGLLSPSPSTTIRMSVKPFAMAIQPFKLGDGQDFTISYTSEQTGVVISFRDTAQNIFTPVSAGAAVTFGTDCNSGQHNYQLVMTSTDDVANARAEITITQTQNQNTKCCKGPGTRDLDGRQAASCPIATCGDVSIAVDPCLLGNWRIDLSQLDAAMQQLLTEDGFTTDSVSLNGGGTFELTQPNQANFVYNDLEIDLTLDVENITVSETSQFQGSGSGNLYMQGTDKFCVVVTLDDGQVEIQVLGGNTTFSLSSLFGLETFSYACDANTLSLTTSANGMQSLSFVYTKD